MASPPIDLDRYFRRVGYRGEAGPTLATLRALHALHAAAIPFENLAAFLGQPVALDPQSLQVKLLTPGRGGWCFEQNLLFAHVLEALGFGIRRLAARVRWNVPPNVTTARSHMLLQVTAEGEDYVADVGFGGQTLTAPLRLEPGIEQPTPHEPHRLMRAGEGFVLEAKVAGEWGALYVFDLHEQQLVDYEVSSWYLANHPQSNFVKGILAARAPPGRRYALRNTRYAVHFPDGRTERRYLASVDQVRVVLERDFLLELPDSPELDRRLARMISENPPD